MNLNLIFQTFLSYFAIKRHRIAAQKLEEICKSENLDEFLAIENSELGVIEYCTTHGFRVLCPERPELNEFIVAKKGIGFSKARNLPYIYLQTKCEPPQLIVEYPCVQATAAGYAIAVKLPIAVAGKIDEHPEGTLVVCITEDSEASADSGYANAVPLPYQKDDKCIHRINMLDTVYAAMLVDPPRF